MATQHSRRAASDLIRWMIYTGAVDKGDLAAYLGIAHRTVDDKLYRGTWTAGEMLDVVTYCHGRIRIDMDGDQYITFGEQ